MSNPTIRVNGKEYPGPTLDDLSFDELDVAYQLGAPMVQPGDEPDLRQMRWLKALVVIALMRAGEPVDQVGALTVRDVEFIDYPEVAGDGPPLNRAARRASAAAKPANGKPNSGGRVSRADSSGLQLTGTTST